MLLALHKLFRLFRKMISVITHSSCLIFFFVCGKCLNLKMQDKTSCKEVVVKFNSDSCLLFRFCFFPFSFHLYVGLVFYWALSGLLGPTQLHTSLVLQFLVSFSIIIITIFTNYEALKSLERKSPSILVSEVTIVLQILYSLEIFNKCWNHYYLLDNHYCCKYSMQILYSL